ncbi:MAG: hypothetical protein H0T78_08755 [Longispora sp.]|nr:hypothetical protein [Longispora sp. (in: high G+C Gram-positive bacteria)]
MTTTQNAAVHTEPALLLSQLDRKAESESGTVRESIGGEEKSASATLEETLRRLGKQAGVIASDKRAQSTAVGTLLLCAGWVAVRRRRRSRRIDRRFADYLGKKWR